VAPLTGKGVEIKGEGSYQGFTLAGFHLSDFSLVKDNATQKLHIKVALTYSPLGGFTDSSEGFRQKLVKRATGVKPSLKIISLGTKLIIAESLKFRLQLIYPLYYRL
jgi:hypothetical protein